jgi:hypothetical protein
MWVMTTAGFVSIVAKGGKNVLMVRSRDLESIKAYCLGAGIDARAIVTGVGTDYPHRVYSNRAEVMKFFEAEMEWLQYKNFKDEAKLVKGKGYADFLGRVWTASLSLEDVPYSKKWAALYDFGDDEPYDWEEKIDPAHLTIKENLGYNGPKKHGKKSKNSGRHKKGHRQ